MRTRAGFVALIGAPNAGKSTLLNQLVGTKVAIVTHKVQTTRTRITGLALADGQDADGAWRAQLVFVDTPGIFAPRRRLDRAMVNAAWSGAFDADETVLVVDAKRGISQDVETILAGLQQEGRTAILALNKVDTIKRENLLALTERLHATGLFTDVFMISARTGSGVDDLKAHLAARMSEGPFLYPEDQVSAITMRMMAAEITREKVYLRLHEELPYAIAVETEMWEDRKGGDIRIEQVIHVQRDTQKKIVIGRGGAMLKQIGQMARQDMEEAFDTRVHLFLRVRISERWADDRSLYEGMGLEFVD